MKYEMKNIWVCDRMSRETICCRATIWRDGKKVGEMENDGNGGPYDSRFKTHEEFVEFRTWCFDTLLKQHHDGKIDMPDINMADEEWVSYQIEQHRNERELKKLIKKSVKTGPYWRYVGDKPGDWRHSKPARGMSVTCMQLAIARWNDLDGGKRVLSEFINDGQHVKL